MYSFPSGTKPLDLYRRQRRQRGGGGGYDHPQLRRSEGSDGPAAAVINMPLQFVKKGYVSAARGYFNERFEHAQNVPSLPKKLFRRADAEPASLWRRVPRCDALLFSPAPEYPAG